MMVTIAPPETPTPSDMFRKIIKDGLRQNHRTQAELAEYMGFTQKHVSHMLRGKSRISLDYLPFMLDFVGLKITVTKKEEEVS